MAVLVYVDDILITGASATPVQKVKYYLALSFKIKDLGDLKYSLGIEVARNITGAYLHQHKYTLDILQDTGLLSCKPSKIPMEHNHTLQDSNSEFLSAHDVSNYRRLVGRLLYLIVTKPDLFYPVHVLSQFLATPKIDHLDAAEKVVRYLKGTLGQGLFMPADNACTLHAYCDSDWAGCKESRHSLTGYCLLFGNSLISWKCKKQPTVSKSSTEAEYMSMVDTCCEITWLLNLFRVFGINSLTPVTLHCDSRSALYIASNSVFNERTKHIEIGCHLIREKLQQGVIITAHIATALQPADMFTKVLSSATLVNFYCKLGVCNLFQTPNLRGAVIDTTAESAEDSVAD